MAKTTLQEDAFDKLGTRSASFDPGDFNMAPISLELLIPGRVSPADLFIAIYHPKRQEIQMQEVCAQGDVLKKSWRDSLQKSRQTKVYVRKADIESCIDYITHAGNAVLEDSGVSSRQKALVVQDIASFNLRIFFGSDLGTSHLAGLVGQCEHTVERLARDFQILRNLGEILATDFNIYSHSVNVCMLSMAFGQFLELPEMKIATLGTAGLLHDVGMAKLEKRSLRKTSGLTEAEFQEVKQHPRLGYEMLNPVSSVSHEVLQVVLNHHENADGSGYPHGLDAVHTPYLARIVRVVDAYDAMTSKRAHREAKKPFQAAKIITENMHQFGKDLVPPFVRFLASSYCTADGDAKAAH